MDNIFGIGLPELFFIAILALIILGPERLPSTLRQIARYWGYARNLGRELTSQFSEEFKALEDLNPRKILNEMADEELAKDNQTKTSTTTPKPAATNISKTTNANAKPTTTKPTTSTATKPATATKNTPAKSAPKPASNGDKGASTKGDQAARAGEQTILPPKDESIGSGPNPNENTATVEDAPAVPSVEETSAEPHLIVSAAASLNGAVDAAEKAA